MSNLRSRPILGSILTSGLVSRSEYKLEYILEYKSEPDLKFKSKPNSKIRLTYGGAYRFRFRIVFRLVALVSSTLPFAALGAGADT